MESSTSFYYYILVLRFYQNSEIFQIFRLENIFFDSNKVKDTFYLVYIFGFNNGISHTSFLCIYGLHNIWTYYLLGCRTQKNSSIERVGSFKKEQPEEIEVVLHENRRNQLRSDNYGKETNNISC